MTEHVSNIGEFRIVNDNDDCAYKFNCSTVSALQKKKKWIIPSFSIPSSTPYLPFGNTYYIIESLSVVRIQDSRKKQTTCHGINDESFCKSIQRKQSRTRGKFSLPVDLFSVIFFRLCVVSFFIRWFLSMYLLDCSRFPFHYGPKSKSSSFPYCLTWTCGKYCTSWAPPLRSSNSRINRAEFEVAPTSVHAIANMIVNSIQRVRDGWGRRPKGKGGGRLGVCYQRKLNFRLCGSCFEPNGSGRTCQFISSVVYALSFYGDTCWSNTTYAKRMGGPPGSVNHISVVTLSTNLIFRRRNRQQQNKKKNSSRPQRHGNKFHWFLLGTHHLAIK